MSLANQPLVDLVADLRNADVGLSPAVVDALRLAETYDHIKPEEFFLPASETLEAYRPVNMNRMLVKVAESAA